MHRFNPICSPSSDRRESANGRRQSFFRAGRALALLVAASSCGALQAQSYPSRAITIIVPFAPGSSADLLARGLAQAFTASLPNNPPVLVDNKPGANGFIAAQAAAKAAPDGYTIFYTTNTTQSANPHLFKKLPYDPVNDFAPISAVGTGAMILAVPNSSPIRTVSDYIAAAKSKQITFGAGNSSSRLAGEMFKQLTGANLLFVPYKSNAPAVVDLMGGQIDSMFADTGSALQLIQAGKLRPIAFTGPARTPFLPSLPTVAESGVKGYSLSYWGAVYAPRGTPPQIINLLGTHVASAVRTPAFKAIFASGGLDPYTTTPDELARFQREESQKWERVIKAAGIEPE